ncbi:MAG: hypothetical protein ACI8UO_005625 [Verrucomicrobiales bacterium]|jgi:hypothetical protein
MDCGRLALNRAVAKCNSISDDGGIEVDRGAFGDGNPGECQPAMLQIAGSSQVKKDRKARKLAKALDKLLKIFLLPLFLTDAMSGSRQRARCGCKAKMAISRAGITKAKVEFAKLVESPISYSDRHTSS